MGGIRAELPTGSAFGSPRGAFGVRKDLHCLHRCFSLGSSYEMGEWYRNDWTWHDSPLNSTQNFPNASSLSREIWKMGAKIWPRVKTASLQTRR